MIEKVTLIGAGNVATQLGLALIEKGIKIIQVYSRNEQSAKELADRLACSFTCDLSAIESDADLYLIAVKDSAIQEVLENLSLNQNQLMVHTAGSISMKIFDDFTMNCGVFYPLQTFSKFRKIDFTHIPLCIEANHPANLLKLQELAQKLSGSVHQIDSEERKALHLAAVFVNNFVNHFYTIGAEILQDKKLGFDLLQPLIYETAEKIRTLHPAEAQTGPAKRNDFTTIGLHLKMLESHPEFQKLYSFATDQIMAYNSKPKT